MTWLLAALITVIPAQQRMGNKITVLLDVSGSLLPHRAEALAAALEVVALAATDETEIRVGVFGVEAPLGEWRDWPVDVEALRVWLRAHTPQSSTCTVLGPALRAALADGDVVIVTDAVIDDASACTVPEGRTVGVVLVGSPGPRGDEFARRLGKTGGVYRRGDE